MTAEFIAQILELAKDGARVLVYTSQPLDLAKKILSVIGGIPVELMEPGMDRSLADVIKLSEAASFLKHFDIIFSKNFDKRSAEIQELKPDHVLNEIDFTPRTCAGKQ